MSWTYAGDPATSDRDWIRWTIGDTLSTDPLQTDDEIAAALTDAGDRRLAAANCCDAISAAFARSYDKSVQAAGAQTITNRFSQRATAYAALAKQIRQQAGLAAVPYAAGISQADMDAVTANTDRVGSGFFPGQFDNKDGGFGAV